MLIHSSIIGKTHTHTQKVYKYLPQQKMRFYLLIEKQNRNYLRIEIYRAEFFKYIKV